MLRRDWTKKVLANLEAREAEIDEIHRAPQYLALSCLSDEDLRAIADGIETDEAVKHFEDLRARFVGCQTAEEARAIYLEFYPGAVNFPHPVLMNLRRIELTARMRRSP